MWQESVLNLKLGGDCNLACPHCHCSPSRFEYNPKIIKWINSRSYQRIVFGGGEPLLYFDTIKRIVNDLEKEYQFKIVTNGTLLDTEKVDWLNQHNFLVIISFDGFEGERDTALSPKWEIAKQLKHLGLSVCCYPGNMDFHKIAQDITILKEQYDLKNIETESFLNHINFPHQTRYAPNVLVTKKQAEEYIYQYLRLLEIPFKAYMQGTPLDRIFLLKRALKRWVVPKTYKGCVCCNDVTHSLTIDGRFMFCPYGNQFVGDIETGIDFNRVNELIPDRCKDCELWNVCRNTCVANITTHECYITQQMNRLLNELIDCCGLRDKIEQDVKELQKT